MPEQLEQLVQKLRRKCGSADSFMVFPKDDPDYRALIEEIRKWEKRDIHCHVSNSLSVEFIQRMYKEKKPEVQDLIKKEAREEVEKAKRMADAKLLELMRAMNYTDAVWESVEALKEHVTSSSELDRSSYKADLRDLVIRSTDDFKRVVCHATKEVFADGVTYLELRFNPSKDPGKLRNLEGLPEEEIIRRVIMMANEGFEEAEREFGRKYRAKMVFSFNTRKERNNSAMLERILWILNILRTQHPELKDRMLGIDLSGSDEGGFYKYNGALKLARDLGFMRTAHFDSLRMRYRGDYAKVKQGIEDIYKIVDELDRIGHGLPLGPLTHGLEKNEELQLLLEKTRQKVKDRGVIIECCPSTNLRSHYIKDYQEHPFHFWTRGDFNLGMGIDGLYYWPSTLSEEIARLLISNQHNLPVSKMKEIASNKS